MIRFAQLVALGLVGIGPVSAQTSPPSKPATAPETLSLTPEEKADILDHQTEQSVDAARAGLPGGGGGKQIHGQIGAAIGTHGMRDVYGAAAIPLGDHAGANVWFEDSRYGPRH